jgi:hypothetical protein
MTTTSTSTSFIMPMPGTLGGAKIVFRDNNLNVESEKNTASELTGPK